MRRVLLLSCVVAWASLMAWAQAQEPGGGGRAGFRRTAKMTLSFQIRGLGELEKGNKAPLTKAQAKQVVALVKPWETKPKMGEEDAKGLNKKINGVLTIKQKNELDRIAAQARRSWGSQRGGQTGGGGGAPGSKAGAPTPEQMEKWQQTRKKMESFFKDYNPFYPPTKYKELKELPAEMREGFTKRYNARKEILAKLEKKASSK